MKKHFVYLSFVLLLSLFLSPFSAMSYGESKRIQAPDLSSASYLPLADGGFFVFGQSSHNESEMLNDVATCMKLDDDGSELWRVNFPFSTETTSFIFAIELPDDIVAVMVKERMEAEPTGRRTVIRIRSGDILGYDEINPGDNVVSPNIMPAKDGYFAFYGERSEPDMNGDERHFPVVEKRTIDGLIEWRHVFEENEVYFEHSLAVEGGYVFSGHVDVQGNNEEKSEGAFAMIGDTGELIWMTTIPAEYRKSFGDMWKRADETILALGNNMKINGQNELLLSGIANNGTLLWEKAIEFGGNKGWFSLYGLYLTDDGFLAMNMNESELVPSSLVFLNEELSVVMAEDITFPENTILMNVWCMKQGDTYAFCALVEDVATQDIWIELYSAADLLEKIKSN